MNEIELKIYMDKIYSIGFKNGQICMKNKIMKFINRDWTLFPDLEIVVKILKKINKIGISKSKIICVDKSKDINK